MFWQNLVKFNLIFLLVILVITGAFFIPQRTQAAHDDYPKLANYYLAWGMDEQKINELAKWDILILSPQVLEYHPNAIKKLKQKNPDIKILVYVVSQEIIIKQDVLRATTTWTEIYETVQKNDWWLRTDKGDLVTFWPGTHMINVSRVAPKTNGQNWSDWLPEFVNNQFLKDGPWDGVFYDNVWHDIDWVNNKIDLDRNGKAESKTNLNNKWQQGESHIITKTRNLAPNKIIIGNANGNQYNKILNGRMQENFPAHYEGGWNKSTERYLNNQLGYTPNYFIVNGFNSTEKQTNYKEFRYGLTSTLLGEGYYSFDVGPSAHDSIWWYDEYNLFLGQALSGPKNIISDSQEMSIGVWQRDFANGLSVVNSTETSQKIIFPQELEKIKGSQDKTINNGSVIRTITLAPHDGVVLLRRVEKMIGSPFYNGSFVRAFDKYGEPVRNGFFLYEKQFAGNQIVAKKDINKDNKIETIVADKSKITVYSNTNQVLASFYPYGPSYKYGINFSLNDYENDGYFEITTGTMRGYAPLVKVFNFQGQEQGPGFNAYHPNYKGGVNVAVCDTNGNGKKEIVTGAGHMGGPQVRIFDKNGTVLSGGFFAYNKSFRGGVNVGCGDIDANGIDEIVTGAGTGGSSHVRYFNSKFEPLSPGFWAFGKDSRTGVRIVINDLNNDGKAEILTASPDIFATTNN